MLRWDEVRRLIVVHAAPAVQPLGFLALGRTMRRLRKDFVDVIDFRCGKWGDRAQVSFGCGLRKFVKENPKPWDCTFYVQPHEVWPSALLEFKRSPEEQVAALEAFAPLFAAEAERWFALLPDLRTARIAADRNTWSGPSSVAGFNVPSPAHEDAVKKLESALADEEAGGPAAA